MPGSAIGESLCLASGSAGHERKIVKGKLPVVPQPVPLARPVAGHQVARSPTAITDGLEPVAGVVSLIAKSMKAFVSLWIFE